MKLRNEDTFTLHQYQHFEQLVKGVTDDPKELVSDVILFMLGESSIPDIGELSEQGYGEDIGDGSFSMSDLLQWSWDVLAKMLSKRKILKKEESIE